ncbi:hypothetical protein [Emticicia fluvialis]|uniref:hypothetical protein n=1 Tax=Emticicia fluvialis TaxID=2974474 RepID=UPI002165222C|nr:hypothetical protein [Emticicia fluvialis]
MNQKIKLLFFKIGILGLATLGTIEALYQINPYAKKEAEISYTASIIEKYGRLKALPSPKIVLVAGSNFAYGINSQMIQDSLHLPVVNMAMHYNYGSDFMLRQIEPQLHKGDIVVMGFEYIVESKGNIGEKITMARMYPGAARWFNYESPMQYLKENAIARIGNMRLTIDRFLSNDIAPSIEDTTSIFFRRAINKYGDLISHLNNPSLKVIPPAILDDSTSMLPAIADMNHFYSRVSKNGVIVYYTFPSYARSSYKADKPVLDRLNKQLTEGLMFPVLGKQQDFIFDDSLCQDMVYHLNAKGRNLRTGLLIGLMKKEMNKK